MGSAGPKWHQRQSQVHEGEEEGGGFITCNRALVVIVYAGEYFWDGGHEYSSTVRRVWIIAENEKAPFTYCY